MKREINILLTIVFLLFFFTGCIYRTDLPLLTKFSPDKKPILIKKITLFNGDPNQKIKTEVNILIKDGKISKISKSNIDISDAVIIDGRGKMAIPGLIDAHTHTLGVSAPPTITALPNKERNMSAYLYAGITTVYDMGDPLKDLKKMADKLSKGLIAGPRLYYAGKIFTKEKGHPAALIRQNVMWPFSSFVISSMVFEIGYLKDIPEMVHKNVSMGASYTKVIVDRIPLEAPSLNVEELSEIVRVSKKYRLKTVAHIGSEDDILTAMKSGIRIFVHAPYRSSISDPTVKKMKKANCIVASTLAVFDNIVLLAQKKLNFTKMDREIGDPYIIKAYGKLSFDKIDPLLREWVEDAEKYKDVKFQNVIKMKEAGITLIAATDTTNVGSFPGSTLHRELELLVARCSFTPVEAVAAATYIPGKFYSDITGSEQLGYLSEGMPADLLILNGDFRKDIRETANINTIILKGRIIERIKPQVRG